MARAHSGRSAYALAAHGGRNRRRHAGISTSGVSKTTDGTTPLETTARGILYAGGAYVVWGVVPLYWRLLDAVPPFEITLHRILWCALFGGDRHAGARALLAHRHAVVRTPRYDRRAGAHQPADHRELDDLHLLRGDAPAGRGEPRLLHDAAGFDRCLASCCWARRFRACGWSAIALATVAVACRPFGSATFRGSRRRWR